MSLIDRLLEHDAWAGSDGSARAFGWPVFALCAATAFLINWAVFVPSFLARTEHFFDLTGSATYVTVVAMGNSLIAADGINAAVRSQMHPDQPPPHW